MAKAPETTTETGETRKRRAPSGPRKIRPFHVAFSVTDANGNPVEGARLNVGKISRDLAEVVDFVDENSNFKRFKLDIPAADKADAAE